MPPRHAALAVVVALVWGVNFVAIDWGLESFPPFLFVSLRFALTAFPAVLLVPRPDVALRYVVGVGLCLGVFQFGLLFLAIRDGLPAGLSSLVIQLQVIFTVVFAFVFLAERPLRRQLWGAAVAFAGLAIIGLARGGQRVPLGPLLLCVVAALSWGAGNVITRKARPSNAVALTIWSSLVPPIPLLAASLVVDGPDAIGSSLGSATALAWGSLLFIVVFATWFGFGSWTWLLGRHEASRVVPFCLLVPVAGIGSTWAALGERPGKGELVGAGVVLVGLAVVIGGVRRWSLIASRR